MIKLVNEIVNYLNEINNNTFTSEELKEYTKDYIYMIENGDIENLISLLNEEYINSNDIKVLEFIKKLEGSSINKEFNSIILELTKSQVDEIKKFLQWNDKNGYYTDENCELEGYSPMTKDETLCYFFKVVNDENYYYEIENIMDNEGNIEEVIKYSKENNIYYSTLEKLNNLFNGIAYSKLV